MIDRKTYIAKLSIMLRQLVMMMLGPLVYQDSLPLGASCTNLLETGSNFQLPFLSLLHLPSCSFFHVGDLGKCPEICVNKHLTRKGESGTEMKTGESFEGGMGDLIIILWYFLGKVGQSRPNSSLGT